MSDLNCPYCGEGQEINHDDGYGYTEGERHHQTCWKCDKVFAYETSISFHYEAEKADCLNGSEHQFEPVVHFPTYWPDRKRCKACGHEVLGEQVENPI